MKWIDIGVNLTNKQFSSDTNEVLAKAHRNGVDTIIITGTHLAASKRAIEIIAEQKASDIMLYSTAGIHPHDASSWTKETHQALKSLIIENPQQIVAVGETGLDFNRNYSTPQQQEIAFEAQLELASELDLPLFLHQRDAHERFFSMIKTHRDDLSNIVVHCFTDTKKALFDYLDIDCHIGITGWVCDERRGKPLLDIVPNIPLTRLMVETDAPYLLPRNLSEPPKNRRNEPQWLPHIGATLAKQYDMDLDALAAAVLKTTNEFFRLHT